MPLLMRQLSHNYGQLSMAVKNLSERFLRSADNTAKAYGAELERLWIQTRTDKELRTDYVLLDKTVTSASVINLLSCMGVTPESLKQRALEDSYLHALILKADIYIDENTAMTEDIMVDILRLLMQKDYEGTP